MKGDYKKSHKTTTIRKAEQQTASYTMIKKAKRQKYDDCNNQTHHTIPHTITTITHNETLAATNSILGILKEEDLPL